MSNPVTSLTRFISAIVGVRPQYTGGVKLLGNQFRAMFMKRILSTYRSWMLILIQILITITFVIIPIVFIKLLRKEGLLPPLTLDLAKFSNPVVIVEDLSKSIYLEEYLKYLKKQNYAYETTKNVTSTMLNLVKILIHIMGCTTQRQ